MATTNQMRASDDPLSQQALEEQETGFWSGLWNSFIEPVINPWGNSPFSKPLTNSALDADASGYWGLPSSPETGAPAPVEPLGGGGIWPSFVSLITDNAVMGDNALTSSGSWQRRANAYASLAESENRGGFTVAASPPTAMEVINIEQQAIQDTFITEPWLFGNSLLEVLTAAGEQYGNSAMMGNAYADLGMPAGVVVPSGGVANTMGPTLKGDQIARDRATYGITSEEGLRAANMANIASYGYEFGNFADISGNTAIYMQGIAQRDQMIAAKESEVAELYAMAELNSPLTEEYQQFVFKNPYALHPSISYAGEPLSSAKLYENAVMQEAELEKLKATSPEQWLEENISVGNQLVIGAGLDPFEIAGGIFSAAKLTKGQRISTAANDLYDVSNGADRVTMASAAADVDNMFAARQPDILSNLNPLDRPAKSQAELGLDTWDILGSSVARATNDRSNTSYLLQEFARDPAYALSNGINVSGIPDLAKQADSAGMYHLSDGLWANDQAIQNWTVFESVKDKMVDLPSLRGDGAINAKAFQEEWNSLFKRATDDYYGVGSPTQLSNAVSQGVNSVMSFVGNMFTGQADNAAYRIADPLTGESLPSGPGYNPLLGPQQPLGPMQGPMPYVPELGPMQGPMVGPESLGPVQGPIYGPVPMPGQMAESMPSPAAPQRGPVGDAPEAPAWLDYEEAPYVPRDMTPANWPDNSLPADRASGIDASFTPFEGKGKHAWLNEPMWKRGPVDDAAVPGWLDVDDGDNFFAGEMSVPDAPWIVPGKYKGEASQVPYGASWADPRPVRPSSTPAHAAITPRDHTKFVPGNQLVPPEMYDDIDTDFAAQQPAAAFVGGLQRIGEDLRALPGFISGLNERQRSAQVELMITAAPGAWVGNATTSNFNAAVDGVPNFKHTDEIEDGLRNRGATRRANEALPSDAAQSKNQDFASLSIDMDGGPSVFDTLSYINDPENANRSFLGKISSYATSLWTGNRDIGGHVGFGEANLYNRAYEAKQVQYLEEYGQPMILGQQDAYVAAGMSESQASSFTNYMADAMIDDPNDRMSVLSDMRAGISDLERQINSAATPADAARLRSERNAANQQYMVEASTISRNAGRSYFSDVASAELDDIIYSDIRPVTLEQHNAEQALRSSVQDVFAQQTLPAYDTAMGGANRAATDQARFTMLDASVKNNAVNAAGVVTPFANYSINSVWNTAQRVATQPGLLSKYSMIDGAVADQNERDGVTLRDEGTIRFEAFGQTARLRNPVDRLLFPAAAMFGNDMYDEAMEEGLAEGDWAKTTFAAFGRVGLSPSWTQGLLSGVNEELTLDEISPAFTTLYHAGSALQNLIGSQFAESKQPDGASGTAQSLPNSLTPMFGNENAEYGIQNYLQQQVEGGKYTLEEGRAISDYMYRLQHGLPAMESEGPEVIGQYNEVMFGYNTQMLVSSFTSAVLGMRIRPVSEGETALNEARINQGTLLDSLPAAEAGQMMGTENQVWDAWNTSVADSGLNPGFSDAIKLSIPGYTSKKGISRPGEASLEVNTGSSGGLEGLDIMPGVDYTYPRANKRPHVPDVPIAEFAPDYPDAIVSLGGPISTLGDSPMRSNPSNMASTPASGPTIADGLPGVDSLDGSRVGTNEVATWYRDSTTAVPSAPYTLDPPVGTPKAGSGAKKEIVGDDFTVWDGIGPASQDKLNNAGYTTFDQLSRASIGEIRDIEGLSESQVQTIYDGSRPVSKDQYFASLESMTQGILSRHRGGPTVAAGPDGSPAPVQASPPTWIEELEKQPKIGPSKALALSEHYDSWAELAGASPEQIDKDVEGFGPVLSNQIVTTAQQMMSAQSVTGSVEQTAQPGTPNFLSPRVAGQTGGPDDGLDSLYALVDPRDDTVHYIGKTTQEPIDRFTQHLNDDVPELGINSPKTAWIRDLLKEGMTPEMRMFAEVAPEDLSDWELIYIGYFVYDSGSLEMGDIGNVQIPTREQYEELMAKRGVSPADLAGTFNNIPNGGVNIGIPDGNGGVTAPLKDWTTAGDVASGVPYYYDVEGLNTAQRAAMENANYGSWDEIVAGGEEAALKRLDKLPEIGPSSAQTVYDYALQQSMGVSEPAQPERAPSGPNKSPAKAEAAEEYQFPTIFGELTSGSSPRDPSVGFDPLAKNNPGEQYAHQTFIPTHGTPATPSAGSVSDVLRGPYDAPKQAGSVADVLRGPYEAPASSGSSITESVPASGDPTEMTMGEAITIAGKLGHVPVRISGPDIDMTGGGPSNPHDVVTGIWGIPDGKGGVIPLSRDMASGGQTQISSSVPEQAAPAAPGEVGSVADILRGVYSAPSQPDSPSHGNWLSTYRAEIQTPYIGGGWQSTYRGEPQVPYGETQGESLGEFVIPPFNAAGGESLGEFVIPPYQQQSRATYSGPTSDRLRGPYYQDAPLGGSMSDRLRGPYEREPGGYSSGLSDRLRGPYENTLPGSMSDRLRGPYEAPESSSSSVSSGYNPHMNGAGNSGPNARADGTLHQFTDVVMKPGVLPGQEFYYESMMRDDGVEVKWDVNTPGYWTYDGSTTDPNRGAVQYDGVTYGNAPHSAGSIAVASVVGGDAKVTQGFGANKDYYREWNGELGHEGIDYGMAVGTPVHSAGAGTVKFAGSGNGYPGYGNYAIIDHGDGRESYYAHLDSLGVETGDSVAMGEELGLSGNTGRSSGPHLHFGIKEDGAWVDPTGYYSAPEGASTAAPVLDASNPYAAEMAAAGKKYGLPPGLVESVAAHETSGYDPNAVSPAGAVGVMQIMPITWQQAVDNVPGLDDPTNPQQSIEAGAYYLDWLRDTLPEDKRSVEWVATAYNWGPNRALQAGSLGDAPPETQAYAQGIAAQVGNQNMAPKTEWRYTDKNPSPEGFFNFEAFPGMSVDKERTLYGAGVTTPGGLAGMSQANLEELPGFGPKSAEEALRYATEVSAMGGIIPPQPEAEKKGSSAAKKLKNDNVSSEGYFNFEIYAGIGAATEQALYDAGITSKEALLAKSAAWLDENIEGFGLPKATSLLAEASGKPAEAKAKSGSGADGYTDKEDTSISAEGYSNFEKYKGVGPAGEQALYDAGITNEQLLLSKSAEWLDENVKGFGPTNSPALLDDVRTQMEAQTQPQGGKKGKPSPRPPEPIVEPVPEVKAEEFRFGDASSRKSGARALSESDVTKIIESSQDTMIEDLLKIMRKGQ